jgi:hypothetical protein
MTESPLSALTICPLFNFKFVLDACYQFVTQKDILICRWWLTFIKWVQIPGYCHGQLAYSCMGREQMVVSASAVFTTALSCARSIQPTLFNPTPVKAIVIFWPHLYKCTQNIILLYMTLNMRATWSTQFIVLDLINVLNFRRSKNHEGPHHVISSNPLSQKILGR